MRAKSVSLNSLLLAGSLTVLGVGYSSFATAELAVVQAESAQTYQISGIRLQYVHQFTELPQAEAIEVELARDGNLYMAADEAGVEPVTMRLSEIGANGPAVLTYGALNAITAAIAEELESRFAKRFFVSLDPRDVDLATGRDLRPGGHGPLRYMAEYTGDVHQVNEFTVLMARADIEEQPSVEELRNVVVRLVPTDEGYVAWRPGVEPVQLTLGDIAASAPTRFTEAGVQQVLLAVRDAVLARELMGVHVTPIQEDLQATRNAPGNVRLVVVTGVIGEIRAVASGERLGDIGPERINHPIHDRIRERSPVQPGNPLRRDILDNYIFQLGRHPGRRVDVAIAPADQPGEVTLDYMVTENRPLLLYVQGSNTGTRQTGRWRQRFGLYHSQLTGNDDIFNIDYNTASFKDAHTVSGFYDARVGDLERLRWRLHGLWGQFDASEVGFAALSFEGEQWQIGAELAANIFQDRQLFIDLVGGARFMHASVRNFFLDFLIQEGREDFLIPYAGLRLERFTEQTGTRASLMFEGSVGEATSIDRNDLNRLGRLFPDKDWLIMQWDLMHTFYLEPLLNPQAFADVSSPESSTLAHEIALGFRGQYAFGNRLIPHLKMVAGGLYSVRGYPESIVSGDTVYIATAEYRFHLPRIFAPTGGEDPPILFGQPFRWAPQHVYGRPDWDLIFRGFIDFARTVESDRQPFERNETLIGSGIGVEFLFRRNLNIRVDWGFALRGIPGEVRSGSSRVHFVGTILF